MGERDVYVRKMDEDVWQAIRIEAIKRGITVGQLVTLWLRERLEQEQERTSTPPPSPYPWAP